MWWIDKRINVVHSSLFVFDLLLTLLTTGRLIVDSVSFWSNGLVLLIWNSYSRAQSICSHRQNSCENTNVHFLKRLNFQLSLIEKKQNYPRELAYKILLVVLSNLDETMRTPFTVCYGTTDWFGCLLQTKHKQIFNVAADEYIYIIQHVHFQRDTTIQ